MPLLARSLWKFGSGSSWHANRSRALLLGIAKTSAFFAGVMNFVYALDAASGKPIPSPWKRAAESISAKIVGRYLPALSL